jgi:NAD(P)-dependent dehydrogenase (short-subunit alcohol dehydrogenase family)
MAARILISGAASGIGAATAEALRSRGADVAGLDVTPGEGLIACDVTDQASVDAGVAEAIERLGGLDVLINCAGIGLAQSAGVPPAPDARRVLDVNLLGPWRVTSAALGALRDSRGRVVNVASGLAHLTIPFATAYCMSKRGLVAYSDALRTEFAGELEVTTLYPGYIRTPIHDAAAEQGIGLDGLVPAERLEDAVRTMVRAAVGPYARDLATTREGTIGYALLRLAPRRLVDRLAVRSLRRAARRGHFDGSELAADMRERLRAA